MRQEVSSFDKAVPRRREIRHREYDPPDLEDADVDAGVEELVRKKPEPMMGQEP